jgi:uncharacterized protein with PIN domain
MDGLCFKCNKDLCKGSEKYVIVSHNGQSRSFHPGCHTCSLCDAGLWAGQKYTVIPATGLAVCEGCWVKQHGGKSNEMPTASGGVSWKPKTPEQKGYVWQQVALLDIGDTPAASKAKVEATEKPLGTCDKCNKKIFLEAVVLSDAVKRHVDCHQCYDCKTSLVNVSFFEHREHVYCELCVTKQVAKMSMSEKGNSSAAEPQSQVQKSLGDCARCKKPVELKVISAAGKVYHPDTCFKCAKCSRKIAGGEPFFPDDDGVLCEKCGE